MKEHAVLVLKNKDNQILFVKRSMNKKTLPGIWAFPSGTVETGEKIFDTIIREAEEELGIEVNPLKIFAETELREFSTRLCFVLCSVKNGTTRINEPDEIDELKWMTFNEFFNQFSDNQIGHGLIWLRKNPDIWRGL
jgi:mutator protein MutT